MLQRVQLLLDRKNKQALDRIAKQSNRSVSSIVREILSKQITTHSLFNPPRGVVMLRKLADSATLGPGNNDYDPYAY